MKQIQIIRASEALDRIFKNSTIIKPMSISFSLYKLRKKIQEHLDWQINQQNTINEQLDTEGVVGPERDEKYNSSVLEIALSEIEVDWDIVHIPEDVDIAINPTDFIQLEGFVDVV